MVVPEFSDIFRRQLLSDGCSLVEQLEVDLFGLLVDRLGVLMPRGAQLAHPEIVLLVGQPKNVANRGQERRSLLLPRTVLWLSGDQL